MVNGVQFAVSSVDWMKMIGCFAQPWELSWIWKWC